MKPLCAAVTLILTLQPCLATAGNAASVRASVIEARHVVYDSMYRNDGEGLRRAITALEALVPRAATHERAYIDYYASLAYWALAASQVQGNDMEGALQSGRTAARLAQAGVDARPQDPEFLAALANALIVVAVLDKPNFTKTAKELAPIRQRALALGRDNPRVVIMDAGMIFANPPSVGGGREKGLDRWREALALFEREANAAAADPLAPRWGHALSWGWLANMLLLMGPDHNEAARAAAATALQMRPDFWYVKEQVLPRLK